MRELLLNGKLFNVNEVIGNSDEAERSLLNSASGNAKKESVEILNTKITLDGLLVLDKKTDYNILLESLSESENCESSCNVRIHSPVGAVLFDLSIHATEDESLLINTLSILHEKYQEFMTLKENENRKKNGFMNARKKRKRNPTFRVFKSSYRNISVSKCSLYFDEIKGSWCINIIFQLFFIPDCINKFHASENLFLEKIFPKEVIKNVYLDELPPILSNMVQKQFITQTVNYTRDNAHKLASRTTNCSELDNVLDGKLYSFQKESVLWLLNKEGYFNNSVEESLSMKISTSDLIKLLNNRLSFGYFSTFYHPKIGHLFWNRITGYLLTKEYAIGQIQNQKTQDLGAKGLLAEEMGLGKTFEIMALITINRRILKDEEPQNFLIDNSKLIAMCKTTLIVCPLSILRQWISEINYNSPSLTIYYYKGFNNMKTEFQTEDPNELARILKGYDIVITSYSTVSSEIHYAQYATSSRSNRRQNLRYDYSSPLSLLQFFRIILDEVQMLRGGSTKAAKCTSLLHRVHTWGVSGTPIQSIRDFQTVLSYLKIHPFYENQEIVKHIDNDVLQNNGNGKGKGLAINSVASLIRGVSFNLSSLFTLFISMDLAYRHCKADVMNEIKIPKQHNIIVPLRFTPIEWDNYMDLWQSFLDDSGYNSDGTGRTILNNMELNQWLNKLRYTCCHAVLPEKNHSLANGESHSVHNLSDILNMMILEIVDRIDGYRRDNYTLQIRSAQYKMENEQKYEESTKILELVRDQLKSIIEEKDRISGSFIENPKAEIEKNIELNEQSNRHTGRRAYLEILHQCEFFLATAHYYQGSFILESLRDKGIIEQVDLKDDSVPWPTVLKDQNVELIKKHIFMEEQLYLCADQTRRILLEERLNKVNETIKEVKNDLNVKKDLLFEMIDFQQRDNFSSSVATSNCFQNLSTIFSMFDTQAAQYNTFFGELKDLVYNPIVKTYDDSNEEEKNFEYASTIEDQDKIYALFDCMERILKNREQVILSEEEIKPSKINNASIDNISSFHQDLLKQLVNIYCEPVKSIFDELKNITIINRFSSRLEESADSGTFENYLLSFEKVINGQLLVIKKMREYLKKLNLVYNTKIEYFAHLQRISDSVTSLSQLDSSSFSSITRSIKNDFKYAENCKKIKVLESRLKYLKNLEKLEDIIQNNKRGIDCTICLQEIMDGAMINCGHIFCQNCIKSWMKNKKSCPLCKVETSMKEIYHFRFQKTSSETAIDAKQEPIKNSSSENFCSIGNLEETIASKYENFDLIEQVEKMIIKDNFGSKIDFVVKLILFLKHSNDNKGKEPPQILIYSQNFDFLKIVSKVLNMHHINNLACLQNNKKIGDAIATFKENSDITCLLLNSKTLGTGLNLLNATHTFILDPIINHNEELQAINRNNRIGQTHETFVWHFMLTNTVEENIVHYKCKLEKLRSNSSEVNDDQKSECSERSSAIEDSSGNVLTDRHIWNCLFVN